MGSKSQNDGNDVATPKMSKMLKGVIGIIFSVVLLLSSIMAACSNSGRTQNPTTITTTTTIPQTPITLTPTQNPTTITTTATIPQTPITLTPTQNPTTITTTATIPQTPTTLTPTPPVPTIIIIAAYDSSVQWKSQSDAICDGKADQSELNKYLALGDTIELAPGDFNCNGNVIDQSDTRLYGQGNTSIIHLDNCGININDVSNIEIDHLQVTGKINPNVINSAIYIAANSTTVIGINIHDILCTTTGGDDFDIYTASQQISNLVFNNDDANNPDGFGFIILGNGPNSTVTNVIFYKCSVENAGVAHGTSNSWNTGFDFADFASADGDLKVSNLYAIDCSVNGAWESGFHMEGDSIIKQNFVITGCNAQNCGQKPSPTYGYGYLVSGDTVFYNNTASSNKMGDLNLYGTIYTPVVNGISPPNSTKTATVVNQGNCSGVIITIDPTHKELVLYSNDGNPVSQQLELGGTYTSADGNNYSFNGTKLIAQFTNYAIMNLVILLSPLDIIHSLPLVSSVSPIVKH